MTSPPAPALLEIATKVLYYGGLSVPVGMGMAVAVLAIPEWRGGVVSPRVRALAPAAAVCVAITATLQFAAAAPRDGSIVQIVAYAFVIIGLMAMRKRASRAIAWGVTVVAAFTAAIPSFSFAAPTVAGTARDLVTFVHVLGALFWIGGLWVLAAVGAMGRRAARRYPEGVDVERSSRDWAQIWERFTIVALWSVGALIVSGSWLAWVHVGSPAQLVTTPYGRYLAVKLVLVVLMLGAGAYNARVLMPKIAAARRGGDHRTAFQIAAEHLPVVVVAEALLALAVLVVVPFLRGSARTEAGWPTAGGFGPTVLGTGLALVAVVASALWLGSRTPGTPRGVPLVEVRSAHPSGVDQS